MLVFPLQPPPLVRCHLPTRGHTVGASCTRNCCSERSHSGGQKPLGCRKEGARVAVPEVNPRKWTFPQQPVPQTRSPTWTGGASFPPCLPAACFFSAPGSVGVAPGDPAQLGKREPLVGRRWRSAAAQGPPAARSRAASGQRPWTEPVAFTAASGPAAACVSLPVRSWPRTLLLPSGVGTGRGGVGEQCRFCSAGSRFCPFQGLGHSCAGPCLPWVMCQTPSATLGGSRWAGVLSGGAAVPRAPRRRPSRPEGHSTAFPSAKNTSGSLSPRAPTGKH